MAVTGLSETLKGLSMIRLHNGPSSGPSALGNRSCLPYISINTSVSFLKTVCTDTKTTHLK